MLGNVRITGKNGTSFRNLRQMVEKSSYFNFILFYISCKSEVPLKCFRDARFGSLNRTTGIRQCTPSNLKSVARSYRQVQNKRTKQPFQVQLFNQITVSKKCWIFFSILLTIKYDLEINRRVYVIK